MQIAIVKDKWDAPSQSSPFRAYLYNHVGEDQAPFYQPGPEDDESKWEEALRQRPDPSYVPVLVKGFWELGKRAQRQKDFLTMMQSRLHEINNCLTELLSRHDLKISVKIADCRRKHLVLSKRCLALAAKTQVLRSRGYAMDDAEEELKKKLTQLERSVFDPSLNGRGEEIWARMLAIHEHSKRLQMEMERAGGSVVNNGEDEIDEQTMKTAKKVCPAQALILTHALILHSSDPRRLPCSNPAPAKGAGLGQEGIRGGTEAERELKMFPACFRSNHVSLHILGQMAHGHGSTGVHGELATVMHISIRFNYSSDFISR